MKVTLTGITMPSNAMQNIGVNTPSKLLAHHARVSNTANQLKHDTGSKLLATLVKRKEWSPFEMVSLTFEIETTRDISHQIIRHRSFSFQEFSQRYAEVDENPIFREARMQHPTDRQSSIPCDDESLAEWLNADQKIIWNMAYGAYKDFIKYGVAKEVARAVLPEGLTPTRLYMHGTLRSWIHYCQLRCEYKTQKEHRIIADEIYKTLLIEFPELKDILEWTGQTTEQ